uniref:Uncharacterized protein n=1 Tax=Oryza punctata TaxID=4537 RepID=A0A0E0MHX8_ORYPU
MESVSAILKVVQAITKAVTTARRNAMSCQELAERAQHVAKILPGSKAVARGDATAAKILRRLRGALDDALQLVESCGNCLSWPLMLATSGGLAAKFVDVNTRINNCLVDLQTANGVRIEEKIDRQAANGNRIEKKLDKLAAGSRDQPNQRRANNSKQREINAGKNGNSNGGWNTGGGQQQNGGKGGKRRRGKKAAGPPPQPQPPFRPRGGAGVPIYPGHHHHSMEEDPTSCSVM